MNSHFGLTILRGKISEKLKIQKGLTSKKGGIKRIFYSKKHPLMIFIRQLIKKWLVSFQPRLAIFPLPHTEITAAFQGFHFYITSPWPAGLQAFYC